jgi:serine/threonine protein kinase
LDDQDDYDVEIMADDWMEHVGQMPETKANLWTVWPNAPSEVIEELWQRLSELHGIAGFLQKIPHQNTSNAMDLSNLKPGYRPIPGKPYELTKELGQGGFGAVWKGKNEKLGRFFVFKFCNEPLNPTKLISLHNELRLVSKLNHPEIVQLHDEYLELKAPYLPCLIYDFVEGVDLHTVLAERKKQERSLSVEEATGLILKIAEIIAYVHSHPEKIVHRDLKPANILVTNPHELALLSAIGGHADLRLARLKVMDFGIGARSSHGRDSASRMNSYGIAFDGFRSEGYASPQQERGEPATECDDVYALGAMWQQFLMGHVPRGTGWNRTLQKKQMTEKQIQVVEACMEDDCDHRIPNAKAMAEKIRSTMPNAALTDSFEESFRKACLAVDEDTEVQIKDLTVDSAALLAANWEHPTLSFPKLESLSIEAAEKLASGSFQFLYLNRLNELTPEVAGSLSRWKGDDLELNGIKELSRQSAEKLAGWSGSHLSLNGLDSLDWQTAEKLTAWKGQSLSLDQLKVISSQTAESLANWKGSCLYLKGLKELPCATAEQIAKWRGKWLYLDGISTISDEAAEKLAGWSGFRLYLSNLRSLSPVIAQKLAAWQGEFLYLDGLESICHEAFSNLVEFRGRPTRFRVNLFAEEERLPQLFNAVRGGNLGLARLLLKEGMKSPIGIQAGQDLLFLAVKEDGQDIVELLIKGINGFRADLSVALTDTGDTPLHVAAKSGHHKVVAVLLNAGAKPKLRNKEGKTALQCAMDSGSMETVRLLVPKDL